MCGMPKGESWRIIAMSISTSSSLGQMIGFLLIRPSHRLSYGLLDHDAISRAMSAF